MGAKYHKGQRVRVLSLRSKYAITKDSNNIEKYEFEIGSIVDSYWATGFKYGQVLLGKDVPPKGYIYKVRMDTDDSEIAVEEDALEPAVD